MMIGVPRFDQTACIAYIIDKLEENGFKIRYTHPNLLFISWNHWVPSYVRTEIKKKAGISIDGYGNIIKEDQQKSQTENKSGIIPFSKLNNKPKNKNDDVKEINSYKPTGNLIYNKDILNSLKNNLNN